MIRANGGWPYVAVKIGRVQLLMYLRNTDSLTFLLQEMKCTRCGKMFDNPANLERHLKEIHFVGVVWLCCQNCDFSHVSMKHFNYHMFRLHRKVGGRKRFPQELKFLTPERIKYRIEHNMRVPDISDNMPRPAAEKSGPSSSSLRRTPARLSANASKRLEKPLVRTTEKPRVTIKAEPNGKSAPRSLRHRNGAGQVVIFSKDRKGSLRRRSAPPAPSTPRTAKPIPKPVPKVIPKPVTPKVIPKPTPKVTPRREEKKSTPRREEKKATPKRVEKIATPRREEKKATPKRDDRKKTPLSKDTKKTPTSSKKTDKPVVKKKPIVPPKKVEAKKSPFKEQKSVKRKSSSKKIIWPEGVSVKDFEIKLNPLDLAAIEAARKKPDAEVDKDLEKSGESPEKAAVEKALEILSKDDEQESPVSPEKSMETDVQVQSSTGTSTDETRPKAGTGETQSEATTGETDSTIKAASETDTNKSTGETDANTSTGEMDANKTTGETVANKSTGETDTSKTSETHPDASTGEPQPDISTDKTQPEASSGETQPKAGTGETQPDAGTTGETQQEEMSGETQLEEKTNETQTELSTSETQPDASSDETQSKMGTGETQPEVSTGKTQVERSTDEANAKESQEDGNAERGKEDKSSPTKTFEKDQELKDSQDQVSSEQVSSTTVEEKEPGSVDEGSGEGTEYSEREVEAVGSSEPMETNDIHAKDVETSENEVGKGEDSIDTGEKLPAEETMDDTEKEQVAIPDDDIEKDAGIEQDESIEQGDERAEDVDQGEKEDVDDADAEADSQRKGQGDEEMETDPVQDDAEMAAFSNGDDDNTNIVTDTRKQDEPIVSSLVPDQEKKGLSPRAKDIPAAPEHQFTPDEPIQRSAFDIMFLSLN